MKELMGQKEKKSNVTSLPPVIYLVFPSLPWTYTAKKIKFSIKDFFSNCEQIRRKPADLVAFTEETLNGKLLFFFLQC